MNANETIKAQSDIIKAQSEEIKGLKRVVAALKRELQDRQAEQIIERKKRDADDYISAGRI